MILDKFFVKLGYEYDPEKMEKFNKGVKSTLSFMKKLSIAAIGLATGFALLYAKIANKGLSQQRIGSALKTTRVELEGIQRVANELTGNRDGAGSLLSAFSNFGTKLKLGQISGEIQQGLSRLKINPLELAGLSTTERLLKIAEAYREATQEVRNFVDQNLGFGADEINFLKGFNKRLLEQLKPIKANFKNIEEVNKIFSRSADEFSDGVQKIGDSILLKLLPAFRALQESIPDLVKSLESATNFIVKDGEDLGKNLYTLFNPRNNDEFLQSINNLSGLPNLFSTSANTTVSIENNISSNNPQFVSSVITESIEKKMRSIAQKNQLLEK